MARTLILVAALMAVACSPSPQSTSATATSAAGPFPVAQMDLSEEAPLRAEIQNAPPDGLFQQVRSEALVEQEVRTKPLSQRDPSRGEPLTAQVDHNHIVVKFREGSAVRLRPQGFIVDAALERSDLTERLTRQNLDQGRVASDLDAFSRLVAERQGRVERKASFIDEETLNALRESAERSSGAEQADLNLYYDVFLQGQSEEAAQALLRRTLELPSVETAYFQPIPVSAGDLPPTTGLNLGSQQNYFRRSPVGIDVDYARRQEGGHGAGVRIIDVEYGWTPDHEDFPPRSTTLPDREFRDKDRDHGTAVLGILWAVDNGFGITGIVPAADIGRVSPTFTKDGVRVHDVGGAILFASNYLRPGDIILIEQQMGPEGAYVPVETARYEFDVIASVTAKGRIVIEAAGNGNQRVDRIQWGDSGAIMVGAIDPTTSLPSSFTNYGARIDVHAWGSRIATLGYGANAAWQIDPAMRINGDNDRLQWYTTGFGGTSGASPIVTGAVALLQANRRARGLDPLKPAQMRALLRATGAAHRADPRNVGVMPNLDTALRSVDQYAN